MVTPLDFFNLIFGNQYVLLAAILTSILIKLFLIGACLLLTVQAKNRESKILTSLLMLFLFGACMDDVFYTTSLIVRGIFQIKGFIPNFTLLFRISWIFFMSQYQALALFFLYLLNKKRMFSAWYIPHILINAGITVGFFYLAVFKYYVPSTSSETLPFELKLVQIAFAYLPILFIPVFFTIFRRIRSPEFPQIIAHQLRYLIAFFIPYLFLEMANNSSSFLSYFLPVISQNEYSSFTLMTVLSSYAMYYICKKMVGLRFLNIRKTIESKEKFNFLEQFKDILEQLNAAEGIREITYPVQGFFQAAFGISLKHTHLFIRKNNTTEKTPSTLVSEPELFTKVERFLALEEHKSLQEALRNNKICIRDDIHFTQFYEENDITSTQMLQFLDSINADIFLPIFERGSLVAYIIIERGARANKLFTNKERDEMLVFTSYLSNIINILKHSNVDALHQRTKRLSEELYLKHQENSQFRESLRSFMRSDAERKIGIVFYKRKFTLANDVAQELIGIDLNKMDGHPLTQAFKSVAHLVQQYKTSQSTFAFDGTGKRVVITGLLGQDGFSVILHIYYPEVSDVVKAQLGKLKDPSHWDYVLYLETTQSGQLVNKLIPGSGEKILNFKVHLLATALSKKATLLDLPENDLVPTVEILHSISLRQTLHTLKLVNPEKNDELAIAFFGLNPLIKKDVPALLEKLDATGTLFIQNVELLSLETQNLLAKFLACGFFHLYKSDHKIFSTVRVICSSNKNLEALVAQGRFSAALYEELQLTSLTMPSFHAFSEEEITELAQGFADQIVTADTYKNLLTLTSKDKDGLIADRPLSLHDFRQKVHLLLTKKSNKQSIQAVSEFNPVHAYADDNIATAVRLGKKALRDPQMMAILWQKFKSQSKIATVLGVNRSSVHRWCQEFNLKS